MHSIPKFVFLLLLLQSTLFAQKKSDEISTREMDRINWMEFKTFIPSKINTVLLPTAMAHTIAKRTNAMIAPTLPYGITGSMEAYPGAFQISESVYRPFVKEILEGLAKNGFKNIIILNGHGGGQTAVLQAVAAEVATELKVRTLVINWWSFASDETKEVFGEDGGHAGLNETAFIQAIDPTLVHPEKYSDEMTTPYPTPGTWAAVPFPSSIGLYKKGEGFPKFNQAKADEYYKKVTDKVANLIQEIIKKWDLAGL